MLEHLSQTIGSWIQVVWLINLRSKVDKHASLCAICATSGLRPTATLPYPWAEVAKTNQWLHTTTETASKQHNIVQFSTFKCQLEFLHMRNRLDLPHAFSFFFFLRKQFLAISCFKHPLARRFFHLDGVRQFSKQPSISAKMGSEFQQSENRFTASVPPYCWNAFSGSPLQSC